LRRIPVRTKALIFLLFLGGWISPTVSIGADQASAYDDSAGWIPRRPSAAMTGSEFAQHVSSLGKEQREEAILAELSRGNLPEFLTRFKPVRLEHSFADGITRSVVIFVMPDYLSVGSDRDFLRVPMNLHTAAELARRFRCILPTKKMVDAIFVQSDCHLVPQPMAPGPQMRSTAYYRLHNEKIREQGLALGVRSGDLVSGHKKDLVLTNRLAAMPGRVAIYGWHWPTGVPIQPLSTVHGSEYADYSHGVRLVGQTVLVDGVIWSIFDLLRDRDFATLVSDEGPLRHLDDTGVAAVARLQ